MEISVGTVPTITEVKNLELNQFSEGLNHLSSVLVCTAVYLSLWGYGTDNKSGCGGID